MALTRSSCKDLIYSILKEMKDQSFKEFKEYLNDEDTLKPLKHIPVAELKTADRIDVPGLLIKHYTKEEALNVTLKLLEAIGETNLAKKLKSKLSPQELSTLGIAEEYEVEGTLQ